MNRKVYAGMEIQMKRKVYAGMEIYDEADSVNRLL